MPSTRHSSGACSPIPKLTSFPLLRWQLLRYILSGIEYASKLLCPHNHDKIFVPYFSTKKQGTELGLSFAQGMIADHHGSIALTTADATFGATFRIELPLEQPQAIRIPQTQ